jgi:hypothetical protein
MCLATLNQQNTIYCIDAQTGPIISGLSEKSPKESRRSGMFHRPLLPAMAPSSTSPASNEIRNAWTANGQS